MTKIEELFGMDREELEKIERETKCFHQQTAGKGDFEGFVKGVLEVSDNEKELWRGMVFGQLLHPYVRVAKREKK